MQLFPYQVVGARWLAGKETALLADDMGVGKSAQAVAACDEVGAASVVVICPASLCENWRREFARFSLLGVEPIVVSYDKAARHPGQLPERMDVLIVDEAHALKSKDAKRTKEVYGPKCSRDGGLAARAERVWVLTGTPMPNHPAELWTHLRALQPESIVSPRTGKPWSYHQFANAYCEQKHNGFGLQIVGGKNHEKLRAKLEPFMLRRTKAEVLKDLPPIRFDELYVEGRLEAADEETALVAEALEKHGVAGLKQVAAHVATLRRLTGLAKVDATVRWVRDWLDSGGEKIVLFAQHREVIERLAAAFSETNVHWVKLDGGGSAGQRQRAVDDFQNDPHRRIFIGQIQAAGTGITLHAASDLLFVESSWVPAENSQAAMRIHRIGQRRACLVRFATLAGSIDEQIQRAVARKTADITQIVGE